MFPKNLFLNLLPLLANLLPILQYHRISMVVGKFALDEIKVCQRVQTLVGTVSPTLVRLVTKGKVGEIVLSHSTTSLNKVDFPTIR